MRSAWLSAVTILAIWLGAAPPVAACKCAAPDLTRSYDAAELALRVRVLHQVPAPRGQRRYLALTLGKPLKGCLPPLGLVLVQSAADSAACGVSFAPGSEQLLFASSEGRRFGLPLLVTGACQGNREYATLSQDEQHFLATRWNCCGAACSCVASEPVQCLADPCQVTRCDVPDATCTANYCGGCGAEWRDASGTRVCQESSSRCDDPDRRYVAHSPDECQRVRFICEAGSAAFFDDCGCGCAQLHPTVMEPCRIGGCSGELCLDPDDANTITTCEIGPEYACYRSATCAPQTDGACGFNATPELEACIETARQPATP